MAGKYPVNRPFMPPLQDYDTALQNIWESGILTHHGPFVQMLEIGLAKKLHLPAFKLVSNGTIAIQIAIKALGLNGEIITTPFTWIATRSAIEWQGCKPVFCDIDPETFNLDPAELRKCITDRTKAILPVHVFGNPCAVDEIQNIADEFGIPVIYDAAHALGTTFQGESVFKWGDVSAVSLHATKIFNTGEGGALYAEDPKVLDQIEEIRFFGFDRNKALRSGGFNGKMTELQAALGVCSLKFYDDILGNRRERYLEYVDQLSDDKNITLQKVDMNGCNFSYFPVVLPSERATEDLMADLMKKGITTRRYFYPSLELMDDNILNPVCRNAESISKRIICLPLYYGLESQDIYDISKAVLSWSRANG